MAGILTAFGDRVLERLAPSRRAKADTGFWRLCYCDWDWWYNQDVKYYAWCEVVGGTSSCGRCEPSPNDC